MARFFSIFLALLLAIYGNQAVLATDQEDSTLSGVAAGPVIVSHIALILPLESSAFAEAAKVVKEGFEVAAQRGQGLPLTIRLYSTSDEPLDILLNYHHAIASGAVFVVGPLTRDGVSAIASSQTLAVPTLTLNTVDTNLTLSANLYLFGLQTDTEANQIAKLAFLSGRNHTIVIGDDSALSKRLQNAFMQRWQDEYNHTAQLYRYTDNSILLQQLRELSAGEERLVFLALDAAKSRIVRAYLDPEVPVYATSQIFTGVDNFLLNNDLEGVRFLDMPWLLQSDHPAVMAYRHTSNPRSTEMERLYALGIDAFRLMTNLLQMHSPNQIAFDGVTGNIRFNPPNLFVREPIPAQFTQGKVQLIRASESISEDERQ